MRHVVIASANSNVFGVSQNRPFVAGDVLAGTHVAVRPRSAVAFSWSDRCLLSDWQKTPATTQDGKRTECGTCRAERSRSCQPARARCHAEMYLGLAPMHPRRLAGRRLEAIGTRS